MIFHLKLRIQSLYSNQDLFYDLMENGGSDGISNSSLYILVQENLNL